MAIGLFQFVNEHRRLPNCQCSSAAPAGSGHRLCGGFDCFILYLATERGLSENYQLSTKRFLAKFSDWAERLKRLSSPREVELANLIEFLATEKSRSDRKSV
jgi:hypothetical protein